MNYSFPATKWVKTASTAEQIEKIQSEYNEFQRSDGFDQETEELIDLYQALETHFRILERLGVNMNERFEQVRKKNEARGYYLDSEEVKS